MDVTCGWVRASASPQFLTILGARPSLDPSHPRASLLQAAVTTIPMGKGDHASDGLGDQDSDGYGDQISAAYSLPRIAGAKKVRSASTIDNQQVSRGSACARDDAAIDRIICPQELRSSGACGSSCLSNRGIVGAASGEA